MLVIYFLPLAFRSAMNYEPGLELIILDARQTCVCYVKGDRLVGRVASYVGMMGQG